VRYFKPEEFKCKHCGANKMDRAFLVLLDELRHQCGFPLTVTSGYRCPVHNQKVSSTGADGPHTTGRAVDIGVSRHRAYDVLRHAMALGFTGIGIQQKGASRFIHLDTLTEPDHAPRPTVWSY
jgi:zinc D-Ala-D-Ala carboxypeptidase